MFSANTSQVAAGAGAVNYIEDVFSTYLYTGNGSGQIIQNGINLGASNTGGSGYFNGSTDYLTVASNAALAFGTGDFTIECWAYANDVTSLAGIYDGRGGSATPTIVFQSGTIKYFTNGGFQITSSSVSTGTWYHIAICRSGTSTKLFVNGVQGGSTYTDSTNYVSTTPSYIGALFDGYYFNGFISNMRLLKGTALYTTTFTPPTAPLTAISGTSLLTLQGATPFVDNSANAFTLTVFGNTAASVLGPFTSATAGKGGLVWLKARSQAYQHGLFDTVRGATQGLVSNNTDPQQTFNSLASFNTNGFSLNSDYNGGATYASWTFREQPKFFDVVTWTGTGSTTTIAHNLGSVPGCIIVKRTDTSDNWIVYHRSLNTTSGGLIALNLTFGQLTDATCFNSTLPTSTVFTVGTSSGTNASGGTYVAYIYAHDAGGFGLTGTDNVISCGSVSVTGSAQSVSLGYEPQWILWKKFSGSDSWWMFDTMRGLVVDNGSGTGDKYLYANSSAAETGTYGIDPTATGFNLAAGWGAGDYIYVTIRRGPMKVPTSGTSVFSPIARTGTGSAATVSTTNLTDMSLIINRDRSANSYNIVSDRLRGPANTTSGSYNLTTNDTVAEYLAGTVTGFNNNNVTFSTNGGVNASGAPYINYFFSRAPSFFDEVCYTGTGSATTFSHNLTVVPELMIVKARTNLSGSSQRWRVYSATLGATKNLILDLDQAVITSSSYWNNTAPTSTLFTVGTNSNVNWSGDTYVAYLFATATGVSKVGSYTGNGTTQTIDCGFTGGARFVLIKQTDASGDWYVYDTARGMTVLTDPYLLLNSTAAEAATLGSVTTVSTGFALNSTILAAINVNGGNYIFLAIA